MAEEKRRPVCNKCRHYFITYDPQMPYGCRSFNFKCKEAPCIQVRKMSGQECEMFEPKAGRQ